VKVTELTAEPTTWRPEARFRVGNWIVYPQRGEIEGNDGVVHLEPKVMQVLVALVDQRGAVVRRKDLLESIWGSRARVSDESLTRAVSVLRKAFGDSARNSNYIQTISKCGYRLVPPVSRLPALQAIHDEIRSSDSLGQARALQSGFRPTHAIVFALGLAIVALSVLS
jgi:DNA-binding winged helix-turn-helix (wHTH) protein